MRRLKLKVSYDGSGYYGFQRLNNLPTIQNEIEKAIKNLTSQKHYICGASRTDKGVHANGQIIHFDTNIDMPLETWKNGLNKRLPTDIRIINIKYVNNNFHARHSSIGKKYSYKISKKMPSPFKSRYEAYYYNLDIEIIKSVMNKFIGIHNFKSFGKVDPNRNPIKEIYSFKLKETNNHYIFYIHGSSFLYHMVRRIIGTLIEIGLKRLDKDIIDKALNSNDIIKTGKTAPACALRLEKVYY